MGGNNSTPEDHHNGKPSVPRDSPNQRPGPSPLMYNWESVIGLTEAKEAIESSFFLPRRFPDFYGLQNSDNSTELLRQTKRCLLFWGPPGTGKTMLGNALAIAHGAIFDSFSPSDVSKFVGETERDIKGLFRKANSQKTVIFIDEIDSFGSTRRDSDPHWARTQINQLLQSIDDFAKHAEVDSVFIACTNMYDHLDDALLRRFDAHIFCGLPTLSERVDMLEFYLKDIRYELDQTQITDIALKAENFSGSDIQRLVRTAAMEPALHLQRSEYFIKDSKTGKYRPSLVKTPDAMEMTMKDLKPNSLERARPVNFNDFLEALQQSKSTIDSKAYQKYLKLRSQNVDDATNTKNAQDPEKEEMDFVFAANEFDTYYATTSKQLQRFVQMVASPHSMIASEYRSYCAIPLLIFLLLLIISSTLLYVLWIGLALFALIISLTSYIWPLYERIQSFRRKDKDNWTAPMDESIIFMVLLTSMMLFGKLTGELPLINVTFWFIDIFPATYFLYILFAQIAILLQFFILKMKYSSRI